MHKQTDILEYSPIADDKKVKLRSEVYPVIKGNIPIDLVYAGKLLEIYSEDRSNKTHGFHKYPAKYIPEIPRWAILKFSKEGNTIIDPFCGSGTTNVEARLNKRNSYAVDVDPIALLLTKVKTTPLDYKELIRVKNSLLRTVYSEKESNLPDFPNRDYWFRPRVLDDLAVIYNNINKIENPDIRDFFLVCFSSILKEVSNADPKFLYALAISRKMREQNNRKIDAKQTFLEKVNELVPKMISFSKICPKDYFFKIIQKDAKDIRLPDASVDIAVTSPPYLNAVDYPRAHQLQLYWLGLWKGKLAELKKLYIGTEQVDVQQYGKLEKYGNLILDDILQCVYQKDRKRSYIIFKYFSDMKNNFNEIKRILKPGKYYCVAVADNLVMKTPVPTHNILMSIADEVGLRTVDYFASVLMMRPHNMRKTEKMNAEWVMVFQKDE